MSKKEKKTFNKRNENNKFVFNKEDIPNLNDNLKTGNTISAPTTPSPYNLPRLSRHFNQEKTFDNVTKEEHKNKLPRSYSLSPGANLWKVFKRNKLIPTDNIFFGSEYHTISNKHIYYRSNHQNRNKLVNKPLYKRRWLQRRGRIHVFKYHFY